MELEHEPSRFDDTEPDDSQDSDYNGSSRTDSVTSSFDDIDFSIEDVKRPFGGIRNEAAARDNFPNQHPESNQRASTQPPTINVVRWYMNTGGSSLSQPSPTIAASSAFSRNDQ
ncbi:hypothetical protein V6N12_062903 [Hibiscus sabdariffa]|uniref:Uncharacterized protein n=1 Tax=Hibiscus sabdariffa TaxID=183260 RepID=A0ABR2FA88_9ROSI